MHVRTCRFALPVAAVLAGGLIAGCSQNPSQSSANPVPDTRPTSNQMPPEARARMEAAQRAAQQSAAGQGRAMQQSQRSGK